MDKILPYALAFAAGLLASFVDYLVSRATVKKDSAKYYATPIRTAIACVFVAGLYIAAKFLGVERLPFLISGAVGATIGLVAFTVLLLKSERKDGGKNGGGDSAKGESANEDRDESANADKDEGENGN